MNIRNLLIFVVLSVVLGNMASLVISPLLKVDLPEICSDWNRFYVMDGTLAVTGALIYVVSNKFGLK